MKYTISSGEVTSTFDTLGAEMKSLKHAAIEYLWQGDPAYWRGQSPVCFPITGALKNNSAVAFGKECTMNRHGIAKHREFDVTCKGDDNITFLLRADDETKESYPFDFELLITYKIIDCTVRTTYKVINSGKEKMPFCIGAHPAFNCPIDTGEYSDWKIEFEQEEDAGAMRADKNGCHDVNRRSTRIVGNTLNLDHSLFEDDSMSFNTLKSKRATLKSDMSEHGVTIEYREFPNLVIWSSRGDAPFIALEPWSGLSYCADEDGIFEHKRNVTVLEAGETAEFSYDITLF